MKHTALCDKEIKAISLDFQELLCSLLYLMAESLFLNRIKHLFAWINVINILINVYCSDVLPLARINSRIILHYTKSVVSCLGC